MLKEDKVKQQYREGNRPVIHAYLLSAISKQDEAAQSFEKQGMETAEKKTNISTQGGKPRPVIRASGREKRRSGRTQASPFSLIT